MRQVALYLREAEQILAAWDFYSDQHSTTDGHPVDEVAYGRRQRQRDADTWRAFQPVLHSGHDLLDRAQAQLAQLPPGARAKRWAPELTALRDSLTELRTLQAEWEEIRQTLPSSARPGTRAWDEPVAERNAEAWSHLDAWATGGQTLLDIAAAAEHTPSPHARARTLESPPAPKGPRRSR